jgi:hypothetical protein
VNFPFKGPTIGFIDKKLLFPSKAREKLFLPSSAFIQPHTKQR